MIRWCEGMLSLKPPLKNELKRIFCIRNLLILMVFIALLFFFMIDGIQNYKNFLANKETFLETEQNKVTQFVLITQYGGYGIRLMFIPLPLCILFHNSSVFNELMANVDTGERLNIYNSFKGKNLFTEKSGGYMDFSGILILIGCLLSLLYGCETFRNKDYLKFISSISNYKNIFGSLVIARLIIITLIFILLVILSSIFALINGVNIVNVSFLIFVFVMLLVIDFFTSAGFAIGTLRNKTTGIVLLGIFYFTSIFIIPWTVNKIVTVKAGDIPSNYKLELKKLKLIMDFERKFYEQFGIFIGKEEAPEEVKKLIVEVLNNEYKKFEEYENEMKKDMYINVINYQTISAFFPIPFFISTNYEISSKGYLNFLDFYSFTQTIKTGFIEYYVKNKFYNKIDKIVPFIKGEEHFFYGKSRIHGRFWLGVSMTLLYIGFALILAYIGFKKSLSCDSELKKNAPAASGLDIQLKQGAYTVITIPDKGIFHHFFNVFFGNIKYFFGKIKLSGTDMVRPEKASFLYLCEVEHVPGDMTVSGFLDFLNQWEHVNKEEMNTIQQEFARQGILEKLVNKLDHDDKIKVLLSACRLIKRQVYMFYNFAHNMSEEMLTYFQEEVNRLKEEGSSIIYFRHNSMFTPYHVDRWLNIVKRDDKYESELVTFDKS